MASKAAADLASRGWEWAHLALLALLALLMADETPTGDPAPDRNTIIRDYYIVMPTTTPPMLIRFTGNDPGDPRGVASRVCYRKQAATIKYQVNNLNTLKYPQYPAA